MKFLERVTGRGGSLLLAEGPKLDCANALRDFVNVGGHRKGDSLFVGRPRPRAANGSPAYTGLTLASRFEVSLDLAAGSISQTPRIGVPLDGMVHAAGPRETSQKSQNVLNGEAINRIS